MGEAIDIIEAVKYIFMGLGIVFFVLLVLVYVFNVQSIAKLFFKFDSEGKLTNEEHARVTTSGDSTESADEKQLTAAIAAALQYHDNSNKQIAAAITAAILHHNNKGE
ncbi:MAG: OadG family protein [Arcobacteraceae bacterium]|jgi:sodium pump decarboxylase gamma subunit